MANNELLEATMRRIEANPEAHHQGSWYHHGECGTTFCFAGHAALLAGAPQPPAEGESPSWMVRASLLPDIHERYLDSVDEDGRMPVSNFAAAALGITPYQRSYLFNTAETPADLRLLVDLIKQNPEVDSQTLYDTFYGPDEDEDDI